MICKTYIAANLKKIECLYNSSTSVQKSLFYSKLAVIELCGWIEISMDDLIDRLALRHLRQKKNITYIQKEVVRRTHSFDYENNFLLMIQAIIGRKGIEQMNKRVKDGLILPLIGALSTLKTARDQLAHQYIKGTTVNIDAPSVTNARFFTVLKGLKSIETVLLKKR